MSTTPTTIETTGSTPEEVDASYKAAFAAATPKGSKEPPRDVAKQISEAHRHAMESIVKSRGNGKSGKAATPRRPKASEGSVLYKDGKALSRNSLSFAAWCATNGIGGAKVDRIGVEALRKILVDNGVAEPETTSWSVVLPNGVTLAHEVSGSPLPATKKAATKAAPAKATTKKSPAKKSTTKKAAPRKRSAA